VVVVVVEVKKTTHGPTTLLLCACSHAAFGCEDDAIATKSGWRDSTAVFAYPHSLVLLLGFQRCFSFSALCFNFIDCGGPRVVLLMSRVMFHFMIYDSDEPLFGSVTERTSFVL